MQLSCIPYLCVVDVWEWLIRYWFAQELTQRGPALTDFKHQKTVSGNNLGTAQTQQQTDTYVEERKITTVVTVTGCVAVSLAVEIELVSLDGWLDG